VLLDFARIVPHFHTHLVFARNAFLQENPALVKRFLDGWFETVRDMRAHPDETIALAAKFEDMPPEVMRRVYPAVMPQMSVTGRFEPAAIDAIRKSLLDTGMVSTDTDLNNMIDTRFVGGAR